MVTKKHKTHKRSSRNSFVLFVLFLSLYLAEMTGFEPVKGF